MTTNYLQGNSKHPQHISVGGVLVNDKKEICCHHFTKGDIPGYWPGEGLNDFYLLMRETMHPNETLEQTLARGLMEEFGATAELVDYVGSLRTHFKDKEVEIEKTTLYFLCQLTNQDPAKRDVSDIEGKTDIEWHMPDFLIPKMKEQARRFGRTDVDESAILERVQPYLVG